ncbi:hypothetical protein F183_A23340 [Bryobacterales bacterium F-183]|nr:hypothetical protein F183_A23340 [Bryobacterales bacterium F-183]
MKRQITAFLLLLAPLSAAITGVATNATTGKVQAELPLILVQPGEQGMRPIGTARTNAQGEFSFDNEAPANGPLLVQALYKGVTYTKAIAPGQPRTGVAVEVFEVSTKPEGIAVDRHGILIEPTDNALAIREFVFVNNTSKATYADPSAGTYRFWAPDNAKIDVTVTTQGGMPVKREATKAGAANTWKIDYPMRPGQTQLEIGYEAPKGEKFSGNILHKDGETRLIVPRGLTLKGEGLTEFAPEPRTQAAIYGVPNGPFTVEIIGKAQPPPSQREADEEGSGSPEVLPTRPRIYSKLYWVVGLTAGILLLGLYSLASKTKAE